MVIVKAFICILAGIIAVKTPPYDYVPIAEQYESPHEFAPELLRVTCYLPTGHKTASGVYPQHGMCASNREHLGDIAAVYDMDRHFIGYFECTDVGGAYSLKTGQSIDIYCDTMAEAREWVRTYGDYCYVVFIEAEG